MTGEARIGTLAIVVTRGTSNSLFQAATLVRAATAIEWAVRVLFRDGAALKLTRERVNTDEWASIYTPVLDQLGARLKAADFVDMESFLRDAKEHGDDVRFWASEETFSAYGLSAADLIPCIDGTMGEVEFAHIADTGDVSLTF